MTTSPRDPNDALERTIREACARGDASAATQAALRGYGAEILGYLCARLGDEAAAREVYSDFSLDLWRGLQGFEWRCSARAWAYTLARNAAHKSLRRRARHAHAPLEAIDDVAAPTPTRTPTFLRTPVVQEMRALRSELRPDERELLTLRIDRRLSWPELAVVLAGSELEDEELRRHTARLRQRFVVTKGRLRKLARKAGLLQ